MKKTRTICIAVLIFAMAGSVGYLALARAAWMPDYKRMADGADLIVIATPIDRQELKVPTIIPGLQRGNKPIPAIDVLTTFSPVVILRGKLPKGKETFVLHHLRHINPAEDHAKNAASLIDFVPRDGSQYLMFLRKRDDARCEAVDGHVDPAMCIEKLRLTMPRTDSVLGTDALTVFICAMHPQIKKRNKGKCPICAMDLTLVTPDK